MTVKSLKKQLVAAIAMVCVAAVALGSSTYAWFVSNNTVTATTASISAQSNAPFLMIDKTGVTEASGTSISYAAAATKLYPAQVVADGTSPKFQSAYAAAKDAATELTGSRYDVGAPDVAVTNEFAISEVFHIGTADTKAGSFKNLKVDKVELATDTGLIGDAISVLLVCGSNWAVYKASDDGTLVDKYSDGTTTAGNNGAGILADAIGAGSEVVVTAYVFYDGSYSDVKTTQLDNLKDGSLTITFTATPVNTQGADVNAPNAVSTTP